MSAEIITMDGLLKDVDAFVAGHLGAAKIHLYSETGGFDRFSLMTDFTELTFTGYSAKNCNTFDTAFRNGGDQAESDADPVDWQPTGTSGLPQSAGMYAVENGTGDALWFGKIEPPFAFNSVDSKLTINPVYLADELP